MLAQDPLAVRLPLYKLHGLNSSKPSCGQRKTANPAERVNHAQRLLHPASPSGSPAINLENCSSHTVICHQSGDSRQVLP